MQIFSFVANIHKINILEAAMDVRLHTTAQIAAPLEGEQDAVIPSPLAAGNFAVIPRALAGRNDGVVPGPLAAGDMPGGLAMQDEADLAAPLGMVDEGHIAPPLAYQDIAIIPGPLGYEDIAVIPGPLAIDGDGVIPQVVRVYDFWLALLALIGALGQKLCQNEIIQKPGTNQSKEEWTIQVNNNINTAWREFKLAWRHRNEPVRHIGADEEEVAHINRFARLIFELGDLERMLHIREMKSKPQARAYDPANVDPPLIDRFLRIYLFKHFGIRVYNPQDRFPMLQVSDGSPIEGNPPPDLI